MKIEIKFPDNPTLYAMKDIPNGEFFRHVSKVPLGTQENIFLKSLDEYICITIAGCHSHKIAGARTDACWEIIPHDKISITIDLA